MYEEKNKQIKKSLRHTRHRATARVRFNRRHVCCEFVIVVVVVVFHKQNNLGYKGLLTRLKCCMRPSHSKGHDKHLIVKDSKSVALSGHACAAFW